MAINNLFDRVAVRSRGAGTIAAVVPGNEIDAPTQGTQQPGAGGVGKVDANSTLPEQLNVIEQRLLDLLLIVD